MNMKLDFVLLFLAVGCIVSTIAGDLDDVSLDDGDMVGFDLDDVSENEEKAPSLDVKVPLTEEGRRNMIHEVLRLAFKRPGAWNRLSQVLPIVRLMSPTQKLALASLVMAQVMADPNDPLPPVTGSKNSSSELMLPISMDIATMFRGLGKEAGKSVLKTQQRSSLGPNIRRPPLTLNGISRRNANVPSEKPLPFKRRPLWSGPKVTLKTTTTTTTSTTTTTKKPPVNATCITMSNNLCLELHGYPEEEILNSILKESHQEIFKALAKEPSQLTEGEHQPKYLERRQGDSGEQNKRTMCSSTVEFARPKKARATSGQWKYIVNTGDYTQTLRLELCSKPQAQCLFLTEEINSVCEQVFNYHRLLTWDETNGLTMDVFKVPTCCSCKVLGYAGLPFPPPFQPTVPPAVQSIADHSDTNLVANDDPPPIRFPTSPPNRNKNGIRIRPYSPAKRRPSVQHRGPPLPLEDEILGPDDSQYPPFDNNLRRITRNNTVDSNRGQFNPHFLMPPSPNNRHPALPIDSLHSESSSIITFTSSAPSPTSSTSSTKRVNYSYHPIIDYFRPQIPKMAENRMGLDWKPIVDRMKKSKEEPC